MLAVLVFTSLSMNNVQAQKNVMMEISWYAYGATYSGLMTTYADNTGDFIVNYYRPNVGYIQVHQDVRVNTKCDGWGNCITYLYGYNVTSDPPVAYIPDNFVIYPNGTVYTQDYNGMWSIPVTARIVPVNQWRATLRRYGINLKNN